jgi:N-sulfoglucosamine sulfohydrolase
MNRQTYSAAVLNLALQILGAGLTCLSLADSVVGSERPNILFVFADDWGRYASAYGTAEPHGLNAIVRTPNFDRVAGSGVLFTRAFVNSPSCTPCRSSLLSGQYFWRTRRGAILHNAVWDMSIPAFPMLLQESGYRIGHSGKVWSPGTPANAPIGAMKTAFNKHGSHFNKFSQQVVDAPDPDLRRNELLDEVRGNFQDFLNSQKADEPFLYWWGPTNTHRTWIQGSGKKLWNINPDSLVGKIPKWLPDVPVVREDVADYLGEIQAMDAGLGVLLDELKITGRDANTLIVVSGDHGMPGVPHGKCNLYDSGTAVPLAVSWPGHFSAGRVVDDFVSLPDLAPTLLEVGNVKVPREMTARSLLSELKATDSAELDTTRDHVVMGRERHVAHARHDFLPYPQRAIRTAEFLYVRNFKPDRWPMGIAPGFGLPDGPMPPVVDLDARTYAAFPDMDASPTKTWLLTEGLADQQYRSFIEMGFALRPEDELYDLKNDPDQIHNVAAEPEFSATRDQLKERLMTILTDSQDPRVIDDGALFEKSPYSDPVQK